MRLTQRFDSIVAKVKADGRQALSPWGEAHLKIALDSSAQAKLDDDEAYIYSRALETVWSTELAQPRAELPLATGDLLPDSPNVEEGSTSYRYFLMNDQGDAEWSASMTGADMPTTSLSGAEMTGRIQTIQGGYVVSRKQLRNAKKASVRLQPRNAAASLRAHLERWDEGLAWGKESLGILGLFNHPLISVINAADAGGSTSWRDKTLEEIVADVAALVNSIPEQTNEIMHANRVLMSPRLFRYCQQTLIAAAGGGDGSLTILRHLERIFGSVSDPNVTPPDFPVTFGVVRYLDASNPRSQGNLEEDALFAYIDNDPNVVSRVRGFVGRTHPPQERDLMIITPAETEVGGVEVAQPLCLVRMNGVFAG
jgi:hypothetical protein